MHRGHDVALFYCDAGTGIGNRTLAATVRNLHVHIYATVGADEKGLLVALGGTLQ